jgi:ATP-dependent Lon protease
MPNFKAIIDSVVVPHLMFLSKDIRHRMPPVLLVGPPGIGKTLFASKLAKVMVVPHLFFVLPAESNGSGLGGSSTFWSNASPGRLFDLLAWGNPPGAAANPLVVLDEADKVQVDRYDPLASLYSLLERDTAAAFEDQALPGLTIDPSHVRFVLTANTVDSIPEALLSRVLIFNIESPTASEIRRIAHQLVRETISGLGINMQAELPVSVLEAAETMCPRQLRTRLEAAIAVTYSAGKHSLDETSWRQTLTEVLPNKRHRMGFL